MTLVYAVLIAVGIRTIAFEPFNIPSASMVPTLLIGDYLFISKFSYGYSRYSMPLGPNLFEGRILGDMPERGDVVVFKLPSDTSVDYIKRVVGLPGDRIQVKGGRLHINGVAVERERIEDFVEPFQPPRPQYVETLPGGRRHRIIEVFGDNGPADNTPEYTVPADHFFMMGDNRDNSADSRADVGFVPYQNLLGPAQFTWLSLQEDTRFWELWEWPWALRPSRMFRGIQ
ncbi:MAG TPA: signal peptidase I [Alphaproteobacteria bacterium]|nr:signal peptidase I [Alphaproteobacteria bacterium]